jgi:pimeloyl-ACP methyl ester carboxylesterase
MSAVAPASPVDWSSLLAGGTRTRLLRAGPAETGEAVVFLHGNPGSADDWIGMAGAAARAGKRAVAFDLPASVTLIDTGLLPGYRWHILARIWRTPVLGDVFQAITTRPAFRFLLNRKEPRGLPREFIEAMYDHYDSRTRKAVLALYRATDDPGGMSEALIGLFAAREIPALVIWGEHDAYLPWSYAARQRDAFPAAEVHVLPASGHWPFADAPETAERLLREFLETLPPN